eukprot:SAG31_NODE_1003_length_10447_cov_3.491593_12_plen_320_part_00
MKSFQNHEYHLLIFFVGDKIELLSHQGFCDSIFMLVEDWSEGLGDAELFFEFLGMLHENITIPTTGQLRPLEDVKSRYKVLTKARKEGIKRGNEAEKLASLAAEDPLNTGHVTEILDKSIDHFADAVMTGTRKTQTSRFRPSVKLAAQAILRTQHWHGDAKSAHQQGTCSHHHHHDDDEVAERVDMMHSDRSKRSRERHIWAALKALTKLGLMHVDVTGPHSSESDEDENEKGMSAQTSNLSADGTSVGIGKLVLAERAIARRAAAKDAIKDFDKYCADEIRSLRSPPELVQDVVFCVGIILSEPHKEWGDCIKWMGKS